MSVWLVLMYSGYWDDDDLRIRSAHTSKAGADAAVEKLIDQPRWPGISKICFQREDLEVREMELKP